MSEVHNAEWFRVEQRMEYHQAPTEKLLELWLADRLAEQSRTPLPSRYGSILVRSVKCLLYYYFSKVLNCSNRFQNHHLYLLNKTDIELPKCFLTALFF